MNASGTSGGKDPQDKAPGADADTAHRLTQERVAADGMGEGGGGAGEDDGAMREEVEGERGIPSVNRVRSMQSRVTTVLAIGCLSVIGVGLLGWYYSQALTRQHRAREVAQSHSTERARSEMILPPLPKITPPRVVAPNASAGAGSLDQPSRLETLLGSAPELPPSATVENANPLAPPVPPYGSPGTPYGAQPAKTPAQLEADRRLGGPVLSTELGRTGIAMAGSAPAAGGAMAGSSATPWTMSVSPGAGAFGTAGNPPAAQGLASPLTTASSAMDNPASAAPAAPSGMASGTLAPRLRASVTPAVQARLLPTQRFLLAKGAFLDCTLETAIDSTLPGLVTCVTATDSFGVDGTTVLIERGSKLIGETQGQMAPGAARVFVLWTEVRTPTGVVVALGSPGTDELGRAGLPGEVNRHFFERFGAAMLISVLDAAVQNATRPSGSGGAVIYNPSASEALATEALKGTLNIPPTLTKHQGDRIQVLVARDLDFRSVYELRISVALR